MSYPGEKIIKTDYQSLYISYEYSRQNIPEQWFKI